MSILHDAATIAETWRDNIGQHVKLAAEFHAPGPDELRRVLRSSPEETKARLRDRVAGRDDDR